jgi:hypothetical protein
LCRLGRSDLRPGAECCQAIPRTCEAIEWNRPRAVNNVSFGRAGLVHSQIRPDVCALPQSNVCGSRTCNPNCLAHVTTTQVIESKIVAAVIQRLGRVRSSHGQTSHNPVREHDAARRWISAVNNLGQFGQWDLHVCRSLQRLEKQIALLSSQMKIASAEAV